MGHLPDTAGALHFHRLVDLIVQPHAAFSPSAIDGESFLAPLPSAQLERLSSHLIGSQPLCVCLTHFSPEAFERNDFERLHVPFPEHLNKAVAKRQSEYLAARVCAHHALQRLGVSGLPWVPTSQRCPRWPQPMVGALSHSNGIAGAVVAHGEDFSGVGIDIESWIQAERAERLAEAILCDDELVAWREIPSLDQRAAWLTRIFSAKESLYKTVYPQVQRAFYFHDASTHFYVNDTRQLTLSLRIPLGNDYPTGFSCKAYVANERDFVVTLITTT